MPELVSMGDQFKGLPMGDLIGGPLKAACDGQMLLAQATADFIKNVGFLPGEKNDFGAARTAKFQYTKMVQSADGTVTPYQAELNVPLLAVVNIPSLAVKRVHITFDMEVKSSYSEKSSLDANASTSATVKGGFFVRAEVNISGSVSTHKENTRSSDNSAKYHVEVLAEDNGTPEGLLRVMDILQSATEPILLDAHGKAMDANGNAITGKIPGAYDEKGNLREGSGNAITAGASGDRSAPREGGGKAPENKVNQAPDPAAKPAK